MVTSEAYADRPQQLVPMVRVFPQSGSACTYCVVRRELSLGCTWIHTGAYIAQGNHIEQVQKTVKVQMLPAAVAGLLSCIHAYALPLSSLGSI